MTNLADGLSYIGVPVRGLEWHESTSEALESFSPTVLLSSWHQTSLGALDWEVIDKYRTDTSLALGLIAVEDREGQSELVEEVLDIARRYRVSFFYKEDFPSYIGQNYGRYRDQGYDVISIGYGANPLVYRPVGNVERDLDYVFLGSAHRDKWPRYAAYMGPIIQERAGFLLGPGWPTGPPSLLERDAHPYLYARGKIGINLHHGGQLGKGLELNERTYNLAASGIPQVIDAPSSLLMRFSPRGFFIGASPEEYQEQFRLALADPKEAELRALHLHREVMTNHTIFHRAREALKQMEDAAIL
jgi:hypothetical protein